ncbi:thermonuclease family protein [Massilibacterium senegalense]|uniref:thermonuclease family protein n=1 Tax=Massilibacterium senegalense TaxID=1632858 RepID=UPI0011CA5D65|nr:thermonuclease family protein [Massilibacterium senegalense]
MEVKFLNEKKEKVRFLLINSPETVGKQQSFGQKEKLYITKLLLHKEVELQIDLKERDKYGRLLAYIFIENRNIQELLLSKGLARVAYVYNPNTEFVEECCKMERIDKEKK